MKRFFNEFRRLKACGFHWMLAMRMALDWTRK